MSAPQASSKGIRPLIFIGAAAFLLTALVSLPASTLSAFVDFERHKTSYEEVRGTIWRGQFLRAGVAGVALGDVDFELSPLSLLTLSPAISLKADRGEIVGHGRVSIAPGTKLSLGDVQADINFGALAQRGVLGAPAQGQVTFTAQRLVLSRKDGCRVAQGTLWTDVLDAPAKRFNMPAMPLSGGIHCDNADLIVTLDGKNARAAAALTLRINRDFAYEIIATAQSNEDDIASALRVFGFEDDNGALTYGTVGVFKGAGS